MAPKSLKQDIPQPPPPPPPSLKVYSMPNRGRGRKHEVLYLINTLFILTKNFFAFFRCHAFTQSRSRIRSIWMNERHGNERLATVIILLLNAMLGKRFLL